MNSFKVVTLLLLLALTNTISGQNYTLSDPNFSYNPFDPFCEVFNSESDIAIDSILTLAPQFWQPHKTSYGISKNNYWIRSSILNSTDKTQELFLQIDNHHLSKIIYYDIKGKTLNTPITTGVELPYKNRAVDYRKFLFPISLGPNEQYSFIARIENKGTSMIMPIKLWNKNTFYEQEIKDSFILILLLSGIGLCFIMGFVSLLLLKKSIYFWYTSYVFTVLVFLLGDMGYLFQHVTYNYPTLHAFTRISIPQLSLFFLIKLSQEILNIKTNFPRIYKGLNLLAIYTLMYMIFENSYFYLGFNNPLIKQIKYSSLAISVLLLIVAAIIGYKQNKTITKLYLFAYTPVLLTIAIFSFKEINILKLSISITNIMYLSTLFEAIVLGTSIVYIAKKGFEEVSNLKVKILESQKKITKSYVEGVEKERERISSQLHDDIGSRLCILQKNFSSQDGSTSMIQDFDTIIKDVRTLSHQLSPDLVNHIGFENSIKSLLESTFEKSPVKVTIQFIGEYVNLSQDASLNLYRVLQELSANALKHSQAKTLVVQLINHQDELVITLEDDGIGFNPDENHSGLGLITIKKRMDYLNGTIEITSALNNGVSTLITLPLKTRLKTPNQKLTT